MSTIYSPLKNPSNQPITIANLKELVFEKQTFLRPEIFVNDLTSMHVLITTKGTGKSWGVMRFFLYRMIYFNEEFAWIRNKEIEFKQSGVEASFVKCLVEFGVEERYVVRKNGIYLKVDDDTSVRKSAFIYMNSVNFNSQNSLQCKWIGYDEFIDPNFSKKDLYGDLLKMFSTMARGEDFSVFLMANKHQADNDVLAGLGIEFDWESKEHQIKIDLEMGVDAYFLSEWNIKEMENMNNRIKGFAKYSKPAREFFAGGISSNTMSYVKNWERNNLAALFKPMFRFDLLETRYVVGEIIDEEQTISFVKKLDYNHEYEIIDNEVATPFCYRALDKLPDNVFVNEVKEYGTVEYLLRTYANGTLYFDTHFSSLEFKKILEFLKILKIR